MTDKVTRLASLERQIARVNARMVQLKTLSDRLANVRLLVTLMGIGGLSVLWFLPNFRILFWLMLLISGIGFGWIVRTHRRIVHRIDEATIWRDIKKAHTARMQLDWQALPKPRFQLMFRHPLEVDLDLRNLHHLLNTATSRGGSDRLREWLLPLKPAEAVVLQRQERVKELISQSLFRDKLVLNAEIAAQEIRDSNEGKSLIAWLNSEPRQEASLQLVLLLGVLSALNITLFILFAAFGLPDVVLMISLLIYATVFVSQFKRINDTFEDSLTIEGALRRLSGVMHFLQHDRYHAMPAIRELVLPIIEQQPTKRLRDANIVIAGASLRANPIFWFLINALIPWDYFFAYRLEKLKGTLGAVVPQWLDIWHELEALSSLANFAYLNPAYTFPKVDNNFKSIFKAEQIGHPLLTDNARVCNDFAMQQPGDIVMITGSNMSGKSSFLRTLGVNMCLTYAGGVVCAGNLNTVIFRLYTSIRVTDSLDDGISYFYAEVKRLKGLLDAINQTDAPPLFFMIDEIFRGTNNRERLIGSRSFIRALVKRNGVGLVATHDLELVALADDNSSISNYHFREDVQNGRMVFDYMLRSGPCPTTNALRIMAMEGLPVEDVPDSL